jgi:SAM-dependent methyltransferase
MTSKPYSESCERNSAPILQVLQQHLGQARTVLEIGSGTGQHAVHFAAAMPWLRWQASDHCDYLPGIRQWLDEAAVPNTPVPLELQAVIGEGLQPLPPLPVHDGVAGFDAVFTANTLHIMGWEEVQALFAGLPSLMAPEGLMVAYGPFNYNGAFTSDSNRNFDGWLKARDPRSGIRDFEAIDALARAQQLELREDVAMPANNRCLVWRRMRG